MIRPTPLRNARIAPISEPISLVVENDCNNQTPNPKVKMEDNEIKKM
jgi:hypothetical protein